ncbi:F-box only protein 43 [Lemur catta]|uniref:F-box only protein 43 n=1 Tax=Lemur catta TaxID=9447 RepID=UPI001E269EE5|nr:F-box only protein 43 [Lemur catta]
MNFKGKDERCSCLKSYITFTSSSSRFADETEILKMSQRHSGHASPGAGNEVDSPTVNFKYCNFRDFSTSSFQDSAYNELKSYSFDNTDKEFFRKKEKSPTVIHEHPETSGLSFPDPLESHTPEKKFLFSPKEEDKSPELWETPKIKKYLLPRRLDVAFSLLTGDSESQNNSLESSVSQVLDLEKNITSSTSDVLRQNYFSSLVTSTLKTEEVTSSSQKLRLNFSQQKTSTIDNSKDDSLFEVECISPIQGNNFKDSTTHDFSDSSLCISDENTYHELLGPSISGTTCGTGEDIFVTPISNLVANIKFNASQAPFPSTEVRGNISTPEDSGFNSLSLDKSEDSLSDQEGSFHELLQKHKGTLKVGDTIRKSRRLVRTRRLSTLREQGSQSEAEEEKQTVHSDSEARPAAASDLSESQLSSDKSEDLTLSFKDLSKTPALQLVHELFMKRKRKRFQQNSAHEFLEERDGGKIAVLQCLLAGLIGKKMGLEKLDILTELKYRNLQHILAMVLDSLTAESLCSVWKVSRNWREIVIQDKRANRRRKFYIIQLKTDSEGAVLNVEDAATRLHLLNRSALRSVQAEARTSSSQKEQVSTLSPWGEVLTPLASSSVTPLSSKQEEYVKVAKTLFIDEALKPCPRCQSPAKYQPYKKRGLCSRKACGFDFCVLCLCAYHGSEECSREAAKSRTRKDAVPGSTQSKRNLKRL